MALTPAQRAFQEGGGLYGALSPEMRESYEETGAFGPPGDAPYTSIGAKQIRYDVPWSVADQYGWTDADGNVSESASDPRHRNYFFGDNFINKLATDWFKKGITTGGNEEIVAHIQENYPEMARAMEAGSGYENLNIGRAIATYDNAIRIQGFQQQNKRSFLQTYGPTALAVAAAVTGNPFLIGTQGALAASEGDLEGVFRSALTLGTGGGGYTDTSSTVGDLVDAYNIPRQRPIWQTLATSQPTRRHKLNPNPRRKSWCQTTPMQESGPQIRFQIQIRPQPKIILTWRGNWPCGTISIGKPQGAAYPIKQQQIFQQQIFQTPQQNRAMWISPAELRSEEQDPQRLKEESRIWTGYCQLSALL